MSQQFAWDELRKSREAAWFQQKEQELVEKLRQRTDQHTQRVAIGEAIGIRDEEILTTLQELGYARETVELLYQVPLVQVAWASGDVTVREREWVLKLAELRGVSPESRAYQQLCDWLERRPSEEFFQTSLRIIGYLFDTLSEKERLTARVNLVNFCTRIAVISGGFLGIGSRICEGEQEALDQIVAELSQRNPEAVQQYAVSFEA